MSEVPVPHQLRLTVQRHNVTVQMATRHTLVVTVSHLKPSHCQSFGYTKSISSRQSVNQSVILQNTTDSKVYHKEMQFH